MEERNQPFPPPPGGSQLPPPPPPYQVTSDIPPSSPYHYSPAPSSRRNRGILGGLAAAAAAAFAYGKYALLFIFKVPALATLGSALVSLVAYGLWGGWTFAIGIVLMIFIHEMGHVVEIRRQGMQATAPIFIPFLGAAIFQRSHPTTAINQALIGIAGPIAGTLGASAALIAYAGTHYTGLLVWAYFGFFINLFNLIPFAMLDGGWILAPVSKWVQVAGLAVLVGLFLLQLVSPIVIILFLIGIPMLIQRFRNPALDAHLTSGPVAARVGLGVAWLALAVYLAFAMFQTDTLLRTVVVR